LLTDKIGLSPDKAGIYVSLAGLSYLPGGLLGGKLSDHFGRKKIMIIFQGAAALMLIPCAFLGKSMIIPWILILVGVLNGAAQPANSAMLADMTNSENRKTALSGLSPILSVSKRVSSGKTKLPILFITLTMNSIYMPLGSPA
jgi:MFS family permease